MDKASALKSISIGVLASHDNLYFIQAVDNQNGSIGVWASNVIHSSVDRSDVGISRSRGLAWLYRSEILLLSKNRFHESRTTVRVGHCSIVVSFNFFLMEMSALKEGTVVI
jgi:hypothetical protein